MRRSCTLRLNISDEWSECLSAGQTDRRISDPRAAEEWVCRMERPPVRQHLVKPWFRIPSFPNASGPECTGQTTEAFRLTTAQTGVLAPWAPAAEDPSPGLKLQTVTSHSSEAGGPGSGCWQGRLLVRALSLTRRTLPSGCVHRAFA